MLLLVKHIKKYYVKLRKSGILLTKISSKKSAQCSILIGFSYLKTEPTFVNNVNII